MFDLCSFIVGADACPVRSGLFENFLFIAYVLRICISFILQTSEGEIQRGISTEYAM